MLERGLLVVISGPSGVGKGTVISAYLKGRDNCVFSVSATTRPRRDGEEDGVHYSFVNRDAFVAMAGRGEMLEWAEYDGNFYGTPREPVERFLSAGKNVILDIEPVGAMQVKKACPEALLIFVAPPCMEVLKQRLAARGTQTEQSRNRRLERAKAELRQAGAYHYIIVNDNVEACRRQLAAILEAQRCAAAGRKAFIEEVLSDA